ncbi:DoxX family membrane protein [Streptomyces sp. NRRL B-1677]|uniref:DoxX family protein n=1 Tax=Streptomyces klenkii TaxID=1420899 RepID=A0A3B0BVK7_9ACTN|nr:MULTISPECIES: DoxX family protein [Streptomyces]MBF6048226.1 DoxX family membrane protein [Streptomyces sp. NRRL B-1677]RKN75566.1 DoxX family protein [Streptomyces klenkii]
MPPTPTTTASPAAPTRAGAAQAPSLTERLDAVRPYALSAFRIVVGLLFACHGAASLFGVLGGAAGSNGGTIAAGTWPGWYAAVIQLVAGVLVLLGAGTRSAAFIASGSMAYAYFDVHQSMALWPIQNGGESSAMFAWAFLLLVFTGPGALSLDRLFSRRK